MNMLPRITPTKTNKYNVKSMWSNPEGPDPGTCIHNVKHWALSSCPRTKQSRTRVDGIISAVIFIIDNMKNILVLLLDLLIFITNWNQYVVDCELLKLYDCINGKETAKYFMKDTVILMLMKTQVVFILTCGPSACYFFGSHDCIKVELGWKHKCLFLINIHEVSYFCPVPWGFFTKVMNSKSRISYLGFPQYLE